MTPFPVKAGAVLEAWCVMHAAGLTLRVLGLGRWLRWLSAVSRTTVNAETAAQSVRVSVAAVRWVERRSVFRWVARRNCLPRSVTLSWLLARRGVASDLRIGVRRDVQAGLAAHAWVEVAGRPLNESANVREQFVAFDRPLQSHHIEATPRTRS